MRGYSTTMQKALGGGLLALALMLAMCALAWVPAAYADDAAGLAAGSLRATANDGLDNAAITVYDSGDSHEVFNGQENYSQAFSGVSYNRASNTLTLSNANLQTYTLYCSNLGHGFKINVVGTNRLQCIDAYGCSLNFVGSGSLSLNESETKDDAIYLWGGYEKVRITAADTVSLKFFEADSNTDGCVYVSGTTATAGEVFAFAGTLSGFKVESSISNYVEFYKIETRALNEDGDFSVYKRTYDYDDGDSSTSYYAICYQDDDYWYNVYYLDNEDGEWSASYYDDYYDLEGFEAVDDAELSEIGLDLDSIEHTFNDWVEDSGWVTDEGFHYGWFFAKNADGAMLAVYRDENDEDSQWECYALEEDEYGDYLSYVNEENPFFVDDENGSPKGLTIPSVYTHTISTKVFTQTAKGSSNVTPTPAPAPAPAPAAVKGIADGATATVAGATYKVSSNAKATVVYQKAPKSKKSVTVPASVTVNGKSYAVAGIAKNAFKGAKAKTVTVKAKGLTKKSVKGCFKGAKKLKTVKVKVGSKKANKKAVKSYKKIFTKKNAGKKVTVK